MIAFLDYGAGNVRSVINGIESLGEKVKVVETAEDILSAERLIFPGVGAFGSMMQILNEKKYVEPLKSYLQSGRPFLGICLGLQALFEGSEESPGVRGLGLLPGRVVRFTYDSNKNLVEARSPLVTGTPHGNDFPSGKREQYTYDTGSSNPLLNARVDDGQH